MKMKKRFLALALCLVMTVSLLPISAAADTYYLTSVTIKASGVKQLSDGKYYVIVTSAIGTYDGGEIDITSRLIHMDGNHCGDLLDSNQHKITTPPEEQATYLAVFPFHASNSTDRNDVYYLKDASIPVKLDIPGYAIGSYSFLYSREYFNCYINITKEHEHTWQFKATGNELTGTCGSCGEKVSVSLKAVSVTLPDSPFNAQLAGKEQFETATGAAISKIRYDYKGSDGVWHKGVDPVAANAKAGEYQAFVEISSLPGTVVDESGTSLNQASLYVKYTAVDPKVTAQTGDNRPIEIMMASVLVFSALAAAAFILDNKRKYSR